MIKYGGHAFKGIATLHSKGTFLTVDGLTEKIVECSLTWAYHTHVGDCDVFAYRPEGGSWDPANVEVDAVKEIVYVADRNHHAIHVFTFTGVYMGHLTNSMGALTAPAAMALRPGPLPSLSSVTPPASLTAGTPYQTTLTLRDSANSPLSPTYPLEAELYRYRITATGFIPGTEIASTIEGTISLSNSSNTLTASLVIPYAGNFAVAVTEGILNPQTLRNGAFQVTVNPAPTDPAHCASSFPTAVTAGSPFAIALSPFDSFSNPTSHPDDEFEAYFDSSPSTRFPLTRSDSTFTFSSPMTAASSYRLHVLHLLHGDTEVAHSPFTFDVSPAPPSNQHCEQAREGITTFDPSTGANLALQVFAFDRFKNLVPNTDRLNVVVDGNHPRIPLLPPTYTHEFHFEPDETREINIAVMLDDAHLPGSPATIQVKPSSSITPATIGGIAAGVVVLVLVFLALYGRQLQRIKLVLTTLRREQEDDRIIFGDKERRLKIQNNNLKDALRKKQHSDVELSVMKAAMDELENVRKDELETVLIDSGEVTVGRLLGKGSFGVVNLATYRGQPTAMKQLLKINDDSVKRFR